MLLDFTTLPPIPSRFEKGEQDGAEGMKWRRVLGYVKSEWSGKEEEMTELLEPIVCHTFL